MFDWLFSLLIPLTFLLAIVILSRRFLKIKLGVNNVYHLWGLVPLGLLLFCLPIAGLEPTVTLNTEIQRFIVIPAENLQQGLSMKWVLSCWLLITLMFAMYWLVNHVLFIHKMNLQTVTSNKVLSENVNDLLPKKLSLFQSSHAFSPMLLGVFNQKLVIPEDFTLLYNEEQQQLILEHEICHFDRNDIYWNLLAFSILALFWFHPLVWLAYFRFRQDQELSCDHIVLAQKQLSSRVNYSRALLLAVETSPPLAFAQLSFKRYGDKDIMFERIQEIKLNTKASKRSICLASFLSVSLLSSLSYAGNSVSIDNAVNMKEIKQKLMPLIRIEPEYPVQAVTDNIEGSVVLKFDVNVLGEVENVSVISAIPENTFNKVAIVALKQWKYQANNHFHKNQLVQLDFRLDENSTFKDKGLIEKIKVTQ